MTSETPGPEPETPGPGPQPETPEPPPETSRGEPSAFPDIAGLAYEQARDELTAIVARLESGQVPLEESMRLWRRGEALAAHCTAWLDDAQAQVSSAGRAEGRS